MYIHNYLRDHFKIPFSHILGGRVVFLIPWELHICFLHKTKLFDDQDCKLLVCMPNNSGICKTHHGHSVNICYGNQWSHLLFFVLPQQGIYQELLIRMNGEKWGKEIQGLDSSEGGSAG